ncbi:mitochondrial carrier domain-containing protein [Thamnocephalis sphaerospora]|uniref:Mitochondrial carrier domain-containing protein n=1 Tax=Thamnocephalis sphaerospora TaxID=78915 RepID=A0A4P9XPP3_9FUNG|nr:mitochondrial carrier domain-containing protein [Thamnocephalis sphaerospora]|eukprot:RKP07411.1 mitochondrial carrier domain-containing protein [Thamnocephalis sphaerospora]
MKKVLFSISLQFFGLAYFKPRFEHIEQLGMLPANSSAALAGVCTGVLQAVGLVTPLELIKVRQQTTVHQGEYRGLSATARHVVREEGSLQANNRQSWGLAVKFTCYTQLRALLRADVDGNATEQPWRAMAAGGLANIVVGVLNSPPDVVKTRMQDAASSHKYANSWQCAVSMARTEGFSSFFRGAWLRVLRIAPGGRWPVLPSHSNNVSNALCNSSDLVQALFSLQVS